MRSSYCNIRLICNDITIVLMALPACRLVAQQLVDRFVTDNGMVVGVDSGDICTSIIQELGARLDASALKGVRIVAACDAAASEAAFVGVPQAMSADVEKV
jgi:ribose 5-phosphate isomerase